MTNNPVKMNDPAACKHARTQLIAKDKDAEYIECLECGAILEGDELQNEPSPDKDGTAGSPRTFSVNGSLSDA
jgi:transcription initiation factor TFIIIB Brf1 subunit/transcription initiation factor TFIIB